jgi:hypothetical protein
MTQPAMSYETQVADVLDDGLVGVVGRLQVTSDAHETTIAGPVADQAALHGLLATVRDRGSELRLARRTDPD